MNIVIFFRNDSDEVSIPGWKEISSNIGFFYILSNLMLHILLVLIIKVCCELVQYHSLCLKPSIWWKMWVPLSMFVRAHFHVVLLSPKLECFGGHNSFPECDLYCHSSLYYGSSSSSLQLYPFEWYLSPFLAWREIMLCTLCWIIELGKNWIFGHTLWDIWF